MIELELVEDAHFGAGIGAGDIDALIDRDRDGQPVIRGSHLKGVLRESANLYHSLGLCTVEAVNALFGEDSGRRGALICSSLYKINSTAQLTENDNSPIWTSTGRELHSRAPLEDTLRIVEHCAAGTRFQGEIQLSDASLAELLRDLLSRTDRFGGSRNRGNGLAKLTLCDGPKAGSNCQGKPKGNQPRLRLLLQAKEPLLLPNSGHPGNLLETEGFIRGQTLLGAFVQRLLQDNLSEPANTIMKGGVAFGDALPLPQNFNPENQNKADIAVMPVPLSLKTPKPSGQQGEYPWWAIDNCQDTPTLDKKNTEDDLDTSKQQDSKQKLKRPGPRQFLYRANSGDAWQRFAPDITVRMRVNVGMRVTEGKTGLFSQEEIAENTHFVSDLIFGSMSDAQAFNTLITQHLANGDWLRVGREGRPVCLTSAIWLSDEVRPAKPRESSWRLTLTSDTILRDDTLAFVTKPDIKSLISVIRAVKKYGTDFSGSENWRINNQNCESTTLHGFNAVSGLRRAPALALRRGSDFWICGKGSERLAHALLKLPALGERTQEGCGRFVIDFSPFGGRHPPPVSAPNVKESKDEFILEIAKALAELLRDLQLPSRSQLGWLRSMAEGGEMPATILDRIDAAAEKQGGKAWKHFKSAILPVLRPKFQSPPLTEASAQRQCLIALVRWMKPRSSINEKQENGS